MLLPSKKNMKKNKRGACTIHNVTLEILIQAKFTIVQFILSRKKFGSHNFVEKQKIKMISLREQKHGYFKGL